MTLHHLRPGEITPGLFYCLIVKDLYFRIVLWKLRNIVLLFLISLTAGCQYFETKKIDSERFYEDEIEAIDWTSVDQYPLFYECDGLTEKEQQLECFTQTLSETLIGAVDSPFSTTSTTIEDTLYLHLSISENAELSVRNIEASSTTRDNIPKLDSLLTSSISAMKLVAPAYKRGIPVKSEFKLPLIIVSKPL